MALFDPPGRAVGCRGSNRVAHWRHEVGDLARVNRRHRPNDRSGGGRLVVRRRDWRSAILLGAAVAGAVGLYNIVKVAVERPRPPSTLWIGDYSGAAWARS